MRGRGRRKRKKTEKIMFVGFALGKRKKKMDSKITV